MLQKDNYVMFVNIFIVKIQQKLFIAHTFYCIAQVIGHAVYCFKVVQQSKYKQVFTVTLSFNINFYLPSQASNLDLPRGIVTVMSTKQCQISKSNNANLRIERERELNCEKCLKECGLTTLKNQRLREDEKINDYESKQKKD